MCKKIKTALDKYFKQLKLAELVKKNTSNNALPQILTEAQEIAEQTRLSKENAELVLKIISKGLKSNEELKFSKCCELLIFLIDAGDQSFKALCQERLKDVLECEDKIYIVRRLNSVLFRCITVRKKYVTKLYYNLLSKLKENTTDP